MTKSLLWIPLLLVQPSDTSSHWISSCQPHDTFLGFLWPLCGCHAQHVKPIILEYSILTLLESLVYKGQRLLWTAKLSCSTSAFHNILTVLSKSMVIVVQLIMSKTSEVCCLRHQHRVCQQSHLLHTCCQHLSTQLMTPRSCYPNDVFDYS
jgi:hypothetical protein